MVVGGVCSERQDRPTTIDLYQRATGRSIQIKVVGRSEIGFCIIH
jgi:hypothetical protein